VRAALAARAVTHPIESEDAVLLEVVTLDGRRHPVAALADVPLSRLAAALARLLGVGDAPYDLVRDGVPSWDTVRTLRELDVLHGTVLRLVPARPANRRA